MVRFAAVLHFKTQHLFCYSDECNDIDLWVGAHSETPVANSVVGPLLQCILGRQFQRLKYADRYWYQNPDAGFNSGTLDILIFLYYFFTGKNSIIDGINITLFSVFRPLAFFRIRA